MGGWTLPSAEARRIPKLTCVTYSMPPESYRTLQPERAVRKGKAWDVALTIVLLVLLPLAALAVSTLSYFLAMASDMCIAGTCDMGVLNTGVWFAIISPWVILVLTLVVAIIRLVRHRLAFWVPLTGAALMVAMFFVGFAIVGAAIQR